LGADAGGAQLDAGQLHPRGGVAAVQSFHDGVELAAGVGLAAGAPQPGAVKQLGAGVLEGSLVDLERGQVVLLGVIVIVSDQRVGAGRVGAGGPPAEPGQRLGGPLRLAQPYRGLDQVRDAAQGRPVVAHGAPKDRFQLD
jgi:hypothetical protein